MNVGMPGCSHQASPQVDDGLVDRDDDRPDSVEFLEGGPGRDSRPGRLARHRWPLLLVLVLAVVALIAIVRAANTPSAPRASHPPAATAPPTAPGEVAPTSGVPIGPPIVVTATGHPLLGVTGRWELFGRGDGFVARIQLAQGRITRTQVPPLGSNGPVSFVVGPTQAIVRPLDFVPGYVVPDGRLAARLSGRLDAGGPAFPGPGRDQVWVATGNGRHAGLTLATMNGRTLTRSIRIPHGGSALAGVSDASGYVVLPGDGGYYDARPDGLHRITDGVVLAGGPTSWLVRDRGMDRGTAVDIDRATGARHVVHATVPAAPMGAIAPDGNTAAMFSLGPTGSIHVFLLDLHSGNEHRVPLSVGQAVTAGNVVWSPDSRWLFAVGAKGRLYAVDGHTGHVSPVAAPLPKLSQLAIRSYPRR
jgi:hypothetical protein